MTPEEKVRERLRKIAALYEGAITQGEREAAASALARLRAQLAEMEAKPQAEPPIEFQISLTDPWARRLFLALCRRYGLRPFRYKRQRRTTVIVRAPRSFVDKTLWPEYMDLRSALDDYLNEATERIIREEVFGDAADAPERA
ncbi:MAG: hypothetical protein U5J83_09375 [Bryobacterales bacterium]|nr:hypothetical protein [Bryobacterales bacterium]